MTRKGFQYPREECHICGEDVAANWLIRHMEKEHPQEVARARGATSGPLAGFQEQQEQVVMVIAAYSVDEVSPLFELRGMLLDLVDELDRYDRQHFQGQRPPYPLTDALNGDTGRLTYHVAPAPPGVPDLNYTITWDPAIKEEDHTVGEVLHLVQDDQGEPVVRRRWLATWDDRTGDLRRTLAQLQGQGKPPMCGECSYLSPKEREQSREKEPHWCTKYDKELLHLGFHPEIVRLCECDEPLAPRPSERPQGIGRLSHIPFPWAPDGGEPDPVV